MTASAFLSSLRVLVVQMGARRGYELARMLEARGALAGMQTSAAWLEGRTSTRLFGGLYAPKPGALERRTVRGVPAHKVRSTLVPEAVGTMLTMFGVESEQRYRIEDWFLGAEARRRGLAGANVVLNTTGNGGMSFLRWAKSKGARIATDIVITPLAHQIVEEEQKRWNDWVPVRKIGRAMATYRKYIQEVIDVSDLLLCPSDAVVEGLSNVPGFDEAKVARVPYALGSTVFNPVSPIPKRVLFCGEAGLRKGLPYLAEAASRLRVKNPDYEIRVAGTSTESIRARPECLNLKFLGQLGPKQMVEEFSRADVFCLPSLAEGMAGAALEALAHALPCVVTRAAGAPIEDGVEGLIVPERDGAAVANAIASIAENRTLRDQMSLAAIERATKHTDNVIGDQLYEALLGLVLSPANT